MSESWKDQRAPSFLSRPLFQEVLRESFERHTATPDVSPEEYLSFKHRQLRGILSGRKLVYLDTNHWINLRHVILSSPLERPGYRDMLAVLGTLQEQQRICCPVSFLLFEELMRQSDPVTRLRTAQLMDRFSSGVCFQFPLELARNELRHFLLRSVAQKPTEPRAWVWTKTGFLAGEILPTEPSVPDATNNRLQKAWTDLMWAVRLEHVLEILDSYDNAMDFWERYAVACSADAVFYRSSELSYDEVLQREKAFLIRKLMEEELQSIGQEIWDEFPECRDPAKLPAPAASDYSPLNLPSLKILAAISATEMLGKMKFDSHDMLDFRHAALAIPYCDAVCCDNPMATRLRNKPCELGRVYGTEILGQPGDILDYLKGLA